MECIVASAAPQTQLSDVVILDAQDFSVLGQNDLDVQLVDVNAIWSIAGPSHSCGLDRVSLWGDPTSTGYTGRHT